MSAAAMRGRGAGSFALAALLATLLLRAPTLGLPLGGEPVAHAALAESLAAGRGYALDGVAHDRLAPLWAGLVSLPLRAGASAGPSARVLAWALAGLASALLVLLGARLTRGRISLALLAALAVFHPALVTYAGGASPGPEALGLALTLAALLAAGRADPWPRRLGLLAAGLLPLVRVEGLALAAAQWACAARPQGASAPRSRRVVAFEAALAFGPFLLWTARTWLVSGGPFGTTWPGSLPSLARVPGNLLVLLGLVLPALGLGVLWLTIPSGLRALARSRGTERVVWRTAWVGAAGALALGLLWGAAPPAGERALPFAASSLPLGWPALPLLLVAGAHGVALLSPAKLRRGVAALVLALAVPLGVVSVWGGLQRALPAGPLLAGRLGAMGDALERALAEAGPQDWIVLDLSAPSVEGVEVLLGERAPPGRRVGVVVSTSPWPRGAFPRAPALPLVEALPKTSQALLLTDRRLEGLVYTGDRPEAGIGGQGIFHRAFLRELRAGRAGTLSLHSLRRPP